MKLTIQELANIVNEQLKEEVESKKDSRQSSVVSERRIRDYMTKGMMSKPFGDGKQKWFGQKHVDQLLALRVLQLRGLSDQYILDNAGVVGESVYIDDSVYQNDESSSDESSIPSEMGKMSFDSSSSDFTSVQGQSGLIGSSVPKHYLNSGVIDFLKKTNTESVEDKSQLAQESQKDLKMQEDALSLLKNMQVSSSYRSVEDNLKKSSAALRSANGLKAVGSNIANSTNRLFPSASNVLQKTSSPKVSDLELFNYIGKKDSKTYVEYVLDEENKIFLKVEQGDGVDVQKQLEVVNEIKSFMLSLNKKGVGGK